MKAINFLFFFIALIIATPSQCSNHKSVNNENDVIVYRAPYLTYNDIQHIPTNLTEDYLLTLNNQAWHFTWACDAKQILTFIWHPTRYNFIVKLLDESGLNGNVCGNLRFATYTVQAERKSDLELINTFHYIFYLKAPNNL
ncbi:MAG: hypothetical protein GW748_03660 [Alphaproteobacteria bacterium]|nr:hypothetical protein [Alphaproteobacteria bacterium]NCQ66820.1 hypothetical protein [Alphaproteobacteria bacterium]NCT07388.1 hypothetical protein [Alphaproteobacteria bacterium]